MQTPQALQPALTQTPPTFHNRFTNARSSSVGRRLARAIATTALITVTCQAGSAERDAQARAQLKQLRAEIGALEQSVKDNLQLQDDAERKLQAIEKQVAEANREANAAQRKLEAHEAELVDLQAQRDRAQLRINTQQDELAMLLRAAHITGQQERIKLLLNQEDAGSVGRLLTYYDYFNRDRVRRIAEIRTSMLELVDIEARRETEVAELRKTQQARQTVLAELQGHRNQRAETLATLQADFSDREKERNRLKLDETALQQLLGGVQKIAKKLPKASTTKPSGKSPKKRAPKKKTPRPKIPKKPFGKLRGQLHWPVPGKIQHSYGSARADGKLTWNGVLIAGKTGAPVRAIAPGRVVYADWLSRLGLLVVIDHGDEYMSLYGHNQTITARVGDRVQAGDAVATVGDSGGQATAGLYFEIRKGSKHFNPKLWCKRKALSG